MSFISFDIGIILLKHGLEFILMKELEGCNNGTEGVCKLNRSLYLCLEINVFSHF